MLWYVMPLNEDTIESPPPPRQHIAEHNLAVVHYPI